MCVSSTPLEHESGCVRDEVLRRVNMMSKALQITLLALLFCANQVSAQDVVTGDITQNLEPEMQDALKNIQPWMQDAQAVEFGPYKIYRPNDETSTNIWVVGPEPDRVSFIDKNQSVIVIGTSTFGVDDRDRDGQYETVTYETLGADGEVTGTVYDWNRDGDLDMKVTFSGGEAPPKVLVPFSGQWRQISKKDGRVTVSVDGKDVEVQKEGYRYVPVAGK